MTRTHATYLFTLVFLCSAVMLDGTERKLDWRKGHLLAVNVEGHGGSTRSVVWRSYCIDGGDHVYSAVSRRKARMNLEVNDPDENVPTSPTISTDDYSQSRRAAIQSARRKTRNRSTPLPSARNPQLRVRRNCHHM